MRRIIDVKKKIKPPNVKNIVVKEQRFRKQPQYFAVVVDDCDC